jgi:hypothetical protein
MSGLQVNFTNQEAESEARVFTPAPSGWYKCSIYDIEEKESTSEKNAGKPYWAVTLQCTQEGDHFKRRFWGNVMLFDGALYSLAQLMSAVGIEIPKDGTFEVPDSESLIGQEILVSVAKVRDTYQMNKPEYDPSEGVIFKNDVKGYKKLDEETLNDIAKSGGKPKSNSLLP